MTSIHIFVRWFCSLSNCTTCAGHCVLQLHTSAPTTATLKWTDHTTGQRQSKTSTTEGSPGWGLRKKRRMKAWRSQKDGSSKRYMVTIGLLSAPTSQWEWTTSQVHLQRPQMHSLMTLHLASPQQIAVKLGLSWTHLPPFSLPSWHLPFYITTPISQETDEESLADDEECVKGRKQ